MAITLEQARTIVAQTLAKGREMTANILEKNKNLDFLYYSNDMIGAGGLLYCLEAGIDVPGKLGLAGFNGVDLIDGLPRKLATMDSCRVEIGKTAALLIANEADGTSDADVEKRIEISPIFAPGDTLRAAQ